jgi:hypothetical protein
VIGIIKSHGGFVNVYSEVGQGTQFKIYLPVVLATQLEQAEDFELPIGHGEVILVIDDEAPIREITKQRSKRTTTKFSRRMMGLRL